MTSEKRDAVMIAVMNEVLNYWPNCEHCDDALQVAAGRGFDAGYAAASRWHSIAEDGLPEPRKFYIVQLTDFQTPTIAARKLGGWREMPLGTPVEDSRVIAWMSLPDPFQPPHEGESNDD